MDPLALDFRRPPAKLHPLGVLSFVLGSVMLTMTGMETRALMQESRRLSAEAAVRALERRIALLPHAARVADAETDPEVSAAHAVGRDLQQRWDDALDALESATTEQVALLAVESPRDTHDFVVAAQAADATDMFDYIRRLQSCAVFARVTLVSHELAGAATDRPVRFRLALIASR